MSLPPNFGPGVVTEGLAQGNTTSFDSLATGIPSSIPNTITPVPTDSAYSLAKLTPLPDSPITPQNLQTLQNVVYGANGRPTQANSLATIDLGDGSVLSFDPTTLTAIATPALSPTNVLFDNPGESIFTASDCRIMVEIPQNPIFNGSQVPSRVARQLIEATTLSVSVHRSKSPVRAFGYINPRGFARGSRTIAGTLIITKTTAEVLYTFLQSGLMADLSKDTLYVKLDQLPPLDFTLLFSNEFGYISSQKLLGVEFVNDGTVVSIQDMLLEQQITWVAADFSPLVPANFNTFFGVNTTTPSSTATQPTPGSVIRNQQTNPTNQNNGPLSTLNQNSLA